ncbi:unnamed protein product [Pieris brassicae]|uniref:Uncharacterized protein n=1 Tax=Pieris brassicae TaxID=7116 RepID=A0A9P0XK69_PIEBR|nr:unnamed protein product [Pieris brassicae]
MKRKTGFISPSFHPEELLSPTSNPITLEGNDLLPLPEIEPNSTSSELSNQMTGSPVQIPEVTPQLSEEQPTAQNIYDDPMPSTSANPDLPVDDYPANKITVIDKLPTEHDLKHTEIEMDDFAPTRTQI